MTKKIKDMAELEATEAVYHLIQDALVDHELKHDDRVSDEIVYNALATMLLNILSHSYKDDIVGLRGVLDDTMAQMLNAARTLNINAVQEAAEELKPTKEDKNYTRES